MTIPRRRATLFRASAPWALAAVCLAWAPSELGAQDLGSDSFGYHGTRASGGFEDIQSGGRPLPGSGSQWGFNVPIGFSFSFYGVSHTSVGVVSAGYLTFGGPTTRVNLPIPSPTPPNAVIAPFWANLDLTKNPQARVYTQTLGSAPSRRFVVEYVDVPFAADPASRLTFEAVLFEGTNVVEFRYQSLANGDGSTDHGSASGGTATVGIEDPTGTAGIQVGYNQASVVRGGDRFTFEPGPAVAPTVSLRSAVASAGQDVDVPLDVSAAVAGLRGLQGTIQVTPDSSGLPDVSVRVLANDPKSSLVDAYVSNPDLAETGPVRFALPVHVPEPGASVVTANGPAAIGHVHLVIPPDAVAGSTYTLTLTDTVLADRSNNAIPATAISGRLTISGVDGGLAASVDTLNLSVAPVVSTGATTNVTVVAMGAKGPIPGVAVSLFIGNAAAISLAATSGVTATDGRFTTVATGVAQGVSTRNLSTRLRHPLREFTEVPERRCLGCCSARRRSRAC